MHSEIALHLQYTLKQQVNQTVGIVIGIIQSAQYIGIVKASLHLLVIIGITLTA